MSTVNSLHNAIPETPHPRNGEPPSIHTTTTSTVTIKPGMEEVNLIKVRTVINANKKSKKGEVAFTDEEIYEANDLCLCYLAGSRGAVSISGGARH